jgi:murein DD-endopeptidase MepM/ murein hydrolase activator NlpD
MGMRRVDRILPGGRAARSGMAIVALAFVAACSSSADRVGPLDGKTAAGDPRYSGHSTTQTASVDRSHTASIPRQGGSHSDDVSSGPLDGGSGYSPPPASASVRSAARGGSVVVAPGDTLYSIARSNSVAVDDLIATNGIQPPYSIRIGQTLVVPGSGYSTAARRAPASTVSHHDVKPGETLYSISRANGFRPDEVARFNSIQSPYALRVGQRLRIPGDGTAVAQVSPARGQPEAARPVQDIANSPTPASSPVRTASIDRQETAAPARRPVTGKLPDPSPRTASKFRWPVKGRIISRFGSKPNGARNDGINIAVPVGTSVKAAENGVVAYAGNELKGYGNLVLIRHADNWVTAYAHNSSLLVQRGDQVTRGQIVAKAGQTGSVTSPQVHFEIRRGSEAVDPLSNLESNQVAGN